MVRPVGGGAAPVLENDEKALKEVKDAFAKAKNFWRPEPQEAITNVKFKGLDVRKDASKTDISTNKQSEIRKSSKDDKSDLTNRLYPRKDTKKIADGKVKFQSKFNTDEPESPRPEEIYFFDADKVEETGNNTNTKISVATKSDEKTVNAAKENTKRAETVVEESKVNTDLEITVSPDVALDEEGLYVYSHEEAPSVNPEEENYEAIYSEEQMREKLDLLTNWFDKNEKYIDISIKVLRKTIEKYQDYNELTYEDHSKSKIELKGAISNYLAILKKEKITNSLGNDIKRSNESNLELEKREQLDKVVDPFTVYLMSKKEFSDMIKTEEHRADLESNIARLEKFSQKRGHLKTIQGLLDQNTQISENNRPSSDRGRSANILINHLLEYKNLSAKTMLISRLEP